MKTLRHYACTIPLRCADVMMMLWCHGCVYHWRSVDKEPGDFAVVWRCDIDKYSGAFLPIPWVYFVDKEPGDFDGSAHSALHDSPDFCALVLDLCIAAAPSIFGKLSSCSQPSLGEGCRGDDAVSLVWKGRSPNPCLFVG